MQKGVTRFNINMYSLGQKLTFKDNSVYEMSQFIKKHVYKILATYN